MKLLGAYRFEVVWAIVTLVWIAAFPVVSGYISILSLAPPALLFQAAVVVLLYRIAMVLLEAGPRSRGVRPVVLLCTILAVWWAVVPVARAATYLRFTLARGELAEIVASERRGVPRPLGTASWKYQVAPGPPLRIVFPLPRGNFRGWPGKFDDWCGFVYDPAQTIIQENGFRSHWSNWIDPSRPATEERLFLLYCSRLDGPYFHCCFG